MGWEEIAALHSQNNPPSRAPPWSSPSPPALPKLTFPRSPDPLTQPYPSWSLCPFDLALGPLTEPMFFSSKCLFPEDPPHSPHKSQAPQLSPCPESSPPESPASSLSPISLWRLSPLTAGSRPHSPALPAELMLPFARALAPPGSPTPSRSPQSSP